MSRQHGLLDRIKTADTPEQVHELMEEGKKYPHTNEKTRRRWNRAARKKLQDFFPSR